MVGKIIFASIQKTASSFWDIQISCAGYSKGDGRFAKVFKYCTQMNAGQISPSLHKQSLVTPRESRPV